MPETAVHPATKQLLPYFEFEHLPPDLRRVASRFEALAEHLVYHSGLTGPELTVGLRKLLEAKDCCVRAALPA